MRICETIIRNVNDSSMILLNNCKYYFLKLSKTSKERLCQPCLKYFQFIKPKAVLAKNFNLDPGCVCINPVHMCLIRSQLNYSNVAFKSIYFALM